MPPPYIELSPNGRGRYTSYGSLAAYYYKTVLIDPSTGKPIPADSAWVTVLGKGDYGEL
ncbi:MAG: hypothetical protein ICV72_13490 [Aldersonia sp.]|nr:hypothetical protein [Aldersonia sp.]